MLYCLTAENACTAAQQLECDGGSSTSICAVDSVNGTDVICQCPRGYALNSTNFCIGRYKIEGSIVHYLNHSVFPKMSFLNIYRSFLTVSKSFSFL